MFTTISFLTQAQNQKYKLPAARTPYEKELMLNQHPQSDPFVGYGKTGIQMPDHVRYPGEFEESQAVAISWSPDYDNSGNKLNTSDTSSIYGYISAQLAKYISDELPVWIRIPIASDTIKIKAFMNSLGWPLTHNYKFFITNGDDWWMRDYGPNGIYYSTKDSVGFVDLKYYDGRDYDNIFPSYLANQLGYKNIVSTLNGEGGNLMSDGFGKTFFSDVIVGENASSGVHSPVWTSTQTVDSIQNLFNSNEPIKLKSLQCDGGTGHIDLYVKLIDEQTLMVSQYDAKVKAQDRQLVEDNYQYLATLKSTYNRPFIIYRIPSPTKDDGTYSDTNCTQLNFDARTFINGITANKIFIYPSFSDDVDGNQAQTAKVTSIYQSLMPGYKIIPVDSRSITTNGGGGAIHCITMQIPAENPVLFWHPSYIGLQPIVSKYHIIAKITNNSGISSAICKWRIAGNASWTNLTLTDSSGYFIGDIMPGTLTNSDKIQYHLVAVTNNGKTAVKPITAPDGFYNIVFKYNTGISQTLEEIKAENHLFAAFPNPSTSVVTVPFNLIEKASVQILITDLMGKEVMSISKNNLPQGLYHETIDASNLNNGIYFYSMFLNGQKIATQKLMIQK